MMDLSLSNGRTGAVGDAADDANDANDVNGANGEAEAEDFVDNTQQGQELGESP